MLQKKTKTQNNTKHLEDAIYKTPPASATDWTGYNSYNSASEEEYENISDMMNVPISPQPNKK